MESEQATGPSLERRREPRGRAPGWGTGLTLIEPNRIVVRGFPVDELMGRVSFGEAIYLLLIGELPSPGTGRLMEAMLVSSIDHGATPPSTLSARNVATTGGPLRACVAAGLLALGRYHGGGITACMRFLESGVAQVRQGASYTEAADRILEPYRAAGEPPPGFGHRFHTRDPRAARLFQMALELEAEGPYIQLIRTVERALETTQPDDRPLPVNVDGAIAAVCGDLGLGAEIGDALFMVSRVPGLVAQSLEEQARERPMRQIDPAEHHYDGPRERRVPEPHG